MSKVLYHVTFDYWHQKLDKDVVINAACSDVSPYTAWDLRFSVTDMDGEIIEVSLTEEEFEDIEEKAIELLNDEKEDQMRDEFEFDAYYGMH